MSVENFLHGIGMVNQSLEQNKARAFEKEVNAVKEKYQTSERVAEEQFKAGESDKERAARIKLEKIQQGPDWARINMAKEQQAREQAGRDTAAKNMGDAAETPVGKMIQPLLQSGAISPQAAIAAIPDRSSMEWITQLNSAAWSAKTPEEAAQFRKMADNAMQLYSDVKEQEAYRKRIAEVKAGGSNMMDYNYDPSPVMASAKSLLAAKFDDYNPSESLSSYFLKKKQKDPSFSREAVREELNAKLAEQIVKTDPKIGGDYLRAYQASSAIWEGFETGGIGSLLKADKLDDEGNMVGSAKGWRPIPIRIDKNTYFKDSSRQSNSTNDISKPIFASPQAGATVESKPLPAEHLADSYIGGKQITTPVASAGK